MRYSSGVKVRIPHGRTSVMSLIACAWLLLGLSADARAQGADRPATAPPPGSGGFCLFEIPGKDGATRLVNIVIVQFVDVMRDRVRLTYGGGNFGSGYESDIPVKSREEGMDIVRRMQQTARECGRHAAATTPPPPSPGTGARITPPISSPVGSTSGADPVPGNR
ncbi:MAG TPA: hypothetical protein PLX20_11805 [Rhodocyclaceae bacterium]|nr:hypothetical protein [Rhodocyclaceae bacterium]HMV54903.1 hypothetical protein [Rhodocyclaceae bacterium]HMZ84147.1 hypothetical protein [Rhodocyclaceae bacterium]HNA04253.1 hypothetical protein [Rhodocyclaceae bacterium]HNB79578.1 hypothetical protein [Rhodocyclaceae bacterium]